MPDSVSGASQMLKKGQLLSLLEPTIPFALPKEVKPTLPTPESSLDFTFENPGKLTTPSLALT